MITLQSVEQFEDFKKQNTVFLFTANWCPDCRFIEPFMDEIEEKFKEMNFVSVNRDEFLDLCIDHNVYGIPSFLVFRNQQLVGSLVSKMRKTKQEIIKFLESVA